AGALRQLSALCAGDDPRRGGGYGLPNHVRRDGARQCRHVRRAAHRDPTRSRDGGFGSHTDPRAGDHSRETTAMNDTELRPTVTEIIEGPVASVDRVYAFDRLRDMCRAAPRSVRRVRTRLTAPPESASGRQAAAEGTLLLDGDLIVCAGVTATT